MLSLRNKDDTKNRSLGRKIMEERWWLSIQGDMNTEKNKKKNEDLWPKFWEVIHLEKVVKEMEVARGNPHKPVEENKIFPKPED